MMLNGIKEIFEINIKYMVFPNMFLRSIGNRAARNKTTGICIGLIERLKDIVQTILKNLQTSTWSVNYSQRSGFFLIENVLYRLFPEALMFL